VKCAPYKFKREPEFCVIYDFRHLFEKANALPEKLIHTHREDEAELSVRLFQCKSVFRLGYAAGLTPREKASLGSLE